MWKTLYDMCTGSPDEQQLYHSISTVATLLLQIGEVGKQYKSPPSSASLVTAANTTTAADTAVDNTATDETIATLSDRPSTSQPEDNVNGKEGRQLSTISVADHDPLNDIIANEREENSSSESLEQVYEKMNLSVDDTPEPQNNADSDSPGQRRQSQPDPDWSINFEQFLASMLTETHLVAIFERDTDIKSLTHEFRTRRLKSSSIDGEAAVVSESPPPVKAVKVL